MDNSVYEATVFVKKLHSRSRAHWIQVNDDIVPGYAQCSSCGVLTNSAGAEYKYCPICGAEMEGASEE